MKLFTVVVVLVGVVPSAFPDQRKFPGGQCCCCCQPGLGGKKLRPKILEGINLDRAGLY